MLALIIASTLAASPGCQERCAQETSACYSGCNGSPQCTRHCGDRSGQCNASCAKEVKRDEALQRGNNRDVPCMGSEGGRPVKRPCTEAEKKRLADALNSSEAKKALCKNAKGQMVACGPDARENTKEVMDIIKKDGVCHDAQGLPVACAGTAEKLQKSGRRMSH